MKNTLLSTLVACTLPACVYDPPMPSSQVRNHTTRPVTLELYFDTAAYRPYWDRHRFRQFLTYNYGFSFPGPVTTLSSFDTVRLVQTYTIPSQATFAISGWGDQNRPVLYSKMRLTSWRDTVEYNGLEAMKKAFIRINRYESRVVLQ